MATKRVEILISLIPNISEQALCPDLESSMKETKELSFLTLLPANNADLRSLQAGISGKSTQ